MISRLAAYAVTTAAFAALLSACGGSGGSGGSNLTGQSDSVSVDVSGLSGSLALQLTPGDTALTITADGVTPFGATVDSGAIYGVTITTQPAGQYCTLGNNAGTVSADVTVSVTCNTSLGGIWKASVGGTQYLEIADEMGGFIVLGTSSASVGFGATLTELEGGAATVSNNSVSGSYVGVDLSGTYPDGSAAGNGTLSGTIASASTLDLATQFTTTNGTVYAQTRDYAYDTLYQLPSSLATIAGNYTNSASEVLSISDSGAIYLQSPGTGCIESGQVSVIDGRYDIYAIQYMYANCSSTSYEYLNGLSFSGIITLDNESGTEVIIGGTTSEFDGDEVIAPLLFQAN